MKGKTKMFEKYNPKKYSVPIIGNSAGYTITAEGIINNEKGVNQHFIFIDYDPYIELEFLGETKLHSVYTLMACHFKWLNDYPVEILKQIEGFRLEHDGGYLVHANNIGYRFKTVPLESLEYPGYYYIQGYPKLLINDSGNIIKLDGTSKYLSRTNPGPKNIKGGYYIASINLKGDVRLHISRHRAMLLAFNRVPDNIESLVANHIDGIPGNDTIDNLEWVTRSGNIDHAFKAGLRSDNKPVLIRHILKKQVLEFHSVAEAARFMNCNDRGLNHMLNQRPFGAVNSRGYQIKYKDDSRDWIEHNNPEEVMQKAIQRIGIKARNCLTYEEHYFSSFGEAGRFTGVKDASIGYRLKKGDYSPLHGWQFIPEDMDKFPDFTLVQYEATLAPSNIKVEARNLLTGEKCQFQSIAKARDSAIGNKGLSMRLRLGQQPILPNGWQFKRENDDWMDIENPEETIYSCQTLVSGRNEETGEIVVANNATEMGLLLNLNPRIIRKNALARGKDIYRGYRFRLGVSNDPWIM